MHPSTSEPFKWQAMGTHRIRTGGIVTGNQIQLDIDILLLEGRADGPIRVQIPDTKYNLYILPCKSLDDYRDNKKMNQAGIYFILGDLSAEDEPNLYIGQAVVRKSNKGTIEHIRENIQNHKHLFCRKAVLLVAPPEDFGATELGLLEDAFINLAREAGRARLSNTTGAHAGCVPEHVKNRLSVIVSNTRLMMATMGIMVLETLVPIDEHTDVTLGQDEDAPVKPCGPALSVSPEFYSHQRSHNRATLIKCGEKWVLREGSWLGKAKSDKAIVLRKDHVKSINGTVTTADISFPSANQAGVFVEGTNTNARKFWRDAEGKTLGEYKDNGEV